MVVYKKKIKPSNAKLRLMGFIFTLIGGILSLVNYNISSHSLELIRHGERTMAIISENANYRDKEGDIMYRPIYSFDATDGKRYSVSSKSSSNHIKYPVGTKVEVIYLSDNPTQATIHTFAELWMATIVLLIFSLLLLPTGLILLLRKKPVNM